jgi:hypothetical protein
MKKQNRRWISALVSMGVAFQAPLAWSAGGRSGTVTQPNTETTGRAPTTTTTTNNNNAVNNYTPTRVSTTATDAAVAAAQANGGNNTMSQGQGAGKSQNMGMIVGLAGAAFSGAMAAATCMKKPPDPSCPLWIMGALASAAVAMAMKKAKDKSDKTVADVSKLGAGPSPTPEDLSRTPEMIETERNLRAATSQVPGMQANLRTGSLRLPDGRTINAADLGNSSALAAAGLSPSEIAAFQGAAQKALKEGEKQARKGLDSSEGANGEELAGSSGSRASSASESPATSGGTGRAVRDPANTDGLTRNYNGDRIGVASDNIFGLINRRYVHVAGQNSLLTPPNQPATPQ